MVVLSMRKNSQWTDISEIFLSFTAIIIDNSLLLSPASGWYQLRPIAVGRLPLHAILPESSLDGCESQGMGSRSEERLCEVAYGSSPLGCIEAELIAWVGWTTLPLCRLETQFPRHRHLLTSSFAKHCAWPTWLIHNFFRAESLGAHWFWGIDLVPDEGMIAPAKVLMQPFQCFFPTRSRRSMPGEPPRVTFNFHPMVGYVLCVHVHHRRQ